MVNVGGEYLDQAKDNGSRTLSSPGEKRSASDGAILHPSCHRHHGAGQEGAEKKLQEIWAWSGRGRHPMTSKVRYLRAKNEDGTGSNAGAECSRFVVSRKRLNFGEGLRLGKRDEGQTESAKQPDSCSDARAREKIKLKKKRRGKKVNGTINVT